MNDLVRIPNSSKSRTESSSTKICSTKGKGTTFFRYLNRTTNNTSTYKTCTIAPSRSCRSKYCSTTRYYITSSTGMKKTRSTRNYESKNISSNKISTCYNY